MRTLLGLSSLVLLWGCKVAASSEDYRWKVKAPSQIPHGAHSKLHFSVETTGSDGQPVAEVPYMWIVDWVGVRGIRHQGWSSREEAIQVKGGPGTAALRILAVDWNHEVVEVARLSFEVGAEAPPAK